MVEDIDVTFQDLANGQAVQLVGLAVGCVVFIPFTKKYGRRSTYIISTAMVAGASWWSAFMQGRVSLYLSNMLFGLAGATNETAIQMSVSNCHMHTANRKANTDSASTLQIRDMFFVHQRGTANGV